MNTNTEIYYVLENIHAHTYVKDIGTGLTDAWGDVKTAERFDTEEEAARFRKTQIDRPDEIAMVCVSECVSVSDDEETPPTVAGRPWTNGVLSYRGCDTLREAKTMLRVLRGEHPFVSI